MADSPAQPFLSEAECAELVRLEKAATPGPWSIEGARRVNRSIGGHVFAGSNDRLICGCRGASGYPLEEHDANAAMIAAARNALPRLLQERSALRARLAEKDAEIERLRAEVDAQRYYLGSTDAQSWAGVKAEQDALRSALAQAVDAIHDPGHVENSRTLAKLRALLSGGGAREEGTGA